MSIAVAGRTPVPTPPRTGAPPLSHKPFHLPEKQAAFSTDTFPDALPEASAGPPGTARPRPTPRPPWVITGAGAADADPGVPKTREADVHVLASLGPRRARGRDDGRQALPQRRAPPLPPRRRLPRGPPWVRKSREMRAMARRTDWQGTWLRQHHPVQLDESEMLMEFVGTTDGDAPVAAPRLVSLRPSRASLADLYDQPAPRHAHPRPPRLDARRPQPLQRPRPRGAARPHRLAAGRRRHRQPAGVRVPRARRHDDGHVVPAQGPRGRRRRAWSPTSSPRPRRASDHRPAGAGHLRWRGASSRSVERLSRPVSACSRPVRRGAHATCREPTPARTSRSTGDAALTPPARARPAVGDRRPARRRPAPATGRRAARQGRARRAGPRPSTSATTSPPPARRSPRSTAATATGTGAATAPTPAGWWSRTSSLVAREYAPTDRVALLGWSMWAATGHCCSPATSGPSGWPPSPPRAPPCGTSPGAGPGAFDDRDDFAHDVFADERLATLATVPVRLDCGRDDPFVAANRAFGGALLSATLTVDAGAHTGAYWRGHGRAQLEWVRARLGTRPPPFRVLVMPAFTPPRRPHGAGPDGRPARALGGARPGRHRRDPGTRSGRAPGPRSWPSAPGRPRGPRTSPVASGVARAHGSYEALVADPGVEAVYVARPTASTTPTPAAAGKHVLVEKAFARSLAETDEVLDAARAGGLLAAEAMWSRYSPHYDAVRRTVEAGTLGDLVLVQADYGQRLLARRPAAPVGPGLAGGSLLDLGVYPIAFADHVLGGPRRRRGTRHPEPRGGRRHRRRHRPARGHPGPDDEHDGGGDPVRRPRRRLGGPPRAHRPGLLLRHREPPCGSSPSTARSSTPGSRT